MVNKSYKGTHSQYYNAKGRYAVESKMYDCF